VGKTPGEPNPGNPLGHRAFRTRAGYQFLDHLWPFRRRYGSSEPICRSRGESIRGVYEDKARQQKTSSVGVRGSCRRPTATPDDRSSRLELDQNFGPDDEAVLAREDTASLMDMSLPEAGNA
jgi:hypothetical protein